jgi:hypothetical protein
LAVLAVVFFIVMTAWGWFLMPTTDASSEVVHQVMRLRTILGTSLFIGMFILLYPFVERGRRPRAALNLLVIAAVLLLIAVIAWELVV